MPAPIMQKTSNDVTRPTTTAIHALDEMTSGQTLKQRR
jgi:hypothetical protein